MQSLTGFTGVRRLAVLLAVLLAIFVLAAMTPGVAAAQSGTIEITTAQQLFNIGRTPDEPLDGTYELMNDVYLSVYGQGYTSTIDSSSWTGWYPIGDGMGNNNWFTGKFYGNGHTIFGLYIDDSHGILLNAGLFGYIASGAVVDSVYLDNADISSAGMEGYYGSLVGTNNGSITGCSTTGSVSSSGSADHNGGLAGSNYGSISNSNATVNVSGRYGPVNGGLVGENSGSISNCYATGEVSGNGDGDGSYNGGLVGINNDGATISNCYATGSVSSSGKGSFNGGLVGVNQNGASISNNSYATGSISGDSDGAYGGLVGTNAGSITGCYATGSAGSSGSGAYNGGLAGDNTGSISNCYATGSFSLSGSGSYNGGLAGDNTGSISNCSATSSFSSSGTYNGGLVGCNGADASISNSSATVILTGSGTYNGGLAGDNSGSISSCSATGSVSGSGTYNGGLVGENGGSITGCYATVNVSGSGAYNGGLVGDNSGPINYCYATGSVDSNGDDACNGGLAGGNSSGSGAYNDTGGISSCYAAGSVSGSGDGAYNGGLVGKNNGFVINCYATGSVSGSVSGSGSGSCNGGLAGDNGQVSDHDIQRDAAILDCYATGSVTSVAGTVYGGLVGKQTNASGTANATVTNSYCLAAAGQIAIGQEYPGYKSIYGERVQPNNSDSNGMTIAKLQQENTFTNTSTNWSYYHNPEIGWTCWDFTNTWGINEGYSYPYLLNVPTSPLPKVTAAASPSGGGTVNGLSSYTGAYNVANEVYLEAVPANGYIFSGWTGGSSTVSSAVYTFAMPADDVNLTANFTAASPIVTLKTAVADGVADTTTSTKIDLTFDTAITGLTADDIAITGGTGAAVKGALTGSGTNWSIALTSVTTQGNVTVAVSAPLGYIISGSPKTVAVYKEAIITTHSITVQNDGHGTGSANQTSAAQGTTITLNSSPDSGYHFKEWQVISPANLSITGNTFIMPDEAVTVKAIWTANSYKITYNLNDGTNDLDNVATYTYGVGLKLSDPTKVNYTFGGWYANAVFTGGQITAISATDTGDKVLFAKWTANSYKITYNLNDGTNNIDNVATYTYGVGLELSDPTKANFTFGGWYADDDFSVGPVTEISETDTGKKELFVKWTADSYPIYYNLDGGANPTSNVSSYTYGVGLELSNPTKDNYTFGGWYGNAGFSGDKVTAISATDTGNKELYAKWTANSYDITYHLNGGTYNTENVSSYTYSEVLTLGTPTKENYTFVGWYGNAGFSGDKVTAISATDTGNKELYAKWTANSYDITYHLNGGTYNTENVSSYTYGEVLTLGTPTKENYTFGGWYGDVELSGDAITAISKTDIGDKELFAKWTANSYTITYNLSGGTNHAANVGTYVYGVGLTLNAPTKANYTFGGWFAQENFSGSAITAISATDTGNKVLFAKWTATRGGGGGGGGDSTAPTVKSTIPSDKAVNVETNTAISVTFSENVQNGSAYDNITVKDPANSLVTVTKNISGDKLTLTPNKELASDTTYTVTLPAGAVKDNAGNSLASQYTFGFTTQLKIPGVAGPGTGPFIDVPDNYWAVNEIVYLNGQGIITGYPDNTYRPNAILTRGQLAVVVAKTLGLDMSAPAQGQFTDVPAGNWAAKAVEATTKAGVMIGYGNGNFKPDQKISRQELVQVIIKALHYGGVTGTVTPGVLDQFTDKGDIVNWAKDAAAEAVGKSLVSGVRSDLFGPKKNATRDQVAVMVYKLFKALGK